MREDGSFNIQQFFTALEIPATEQPIVQDCLVRGLATYYRHLYGYDKYGSYPEFLINERMYEPYIFGFGAVQVVRHPHLSLATQQHIVKYTLQQIDPTEEFGVPCGLLSLLGFLARSHLLEASTFRAVLIIVFTSSNHSEFEDWEKSDLFSLLEWLLGSGHISSEEQIWWLQALATYLKNPHLGQAFVDYILQHFAPSNDWKQEMCRAWLSEHAAGQIPIEIQVLTANLQSDESALESMLMGHGLELAAESNGTQLIVSDNYGIRTAMLLKGQIYPLTLPSVRRKAIVALVRFGADPLTVCQTYFSMDHHEWVQSFNQGVADILLAYRSQIPAEAARQFVEQGIHHAKVATRKVFFRVGYELFGASYLTRAQTEKTKSIRDWALKQQAKPSVPNQT